MAKPQPSAPADCVAQYERLLATIPAIERKGAALPYTSHNGNMFSIMTASGTLGLRLAPADREAFLAEHSAELLRNYGIVQKEYVAVPTELLADTAAMTPWLAKSWSYVQSLRAKPTTRPKKA